MHRVAERRATAAPAPPAGAEPRAATGIDIQGLTKNFTLGRKTVRRWPRSTWAPRRTRSCRCSGPSGCGKSTDPAHPRRPGEPDVGHGADQRPVDPGDPARPPAGHRLPGGGAAALAQRGREHPAAAGGGRDQPGAGPDRRPDRAGRADRVREGQARAAVRRHAPAGGDRPLPGRAADGDAARRAVRRAGRHDPAAAERRAAADLDRATGHHADGHPRHLRGGVPLRRGRGDERRGPGRIAEVVEIDLPRPRHPEHDAHPGVPRLSSTGSRRSCSAGAASGSDSR